MNDTELYLIRHGQAVINVEGSVDGTCLGLTAKGREQAKRVAARLRDVPPEGIRFDAAYCSTRLRCVQTAEIISSALGLDFIQDEQLRNADYGTEGIDPWDVKRNDIGTIPPLAPMRRPTATAECWQSFLSRCGVRLLDLANEHRGRRVLIVGHSETSAAALHTMFKMPDGASRWRYPVMNHAAITVWRHERLFADELPEPAYQWCLVHQNDEHHLRELA